MMNTGLLILRIVVGAALVGHGTQKLFGWYGGHGPRTTGAFFEMLGYRPGTFFAVIAGLSEAVGGALLAFGGLTPLAGAAIVGVMLNAAYALRSRPVGDERRLGVPGRSRRGRSVAGADRSRVVLGGPCARTRLVGGVGRRERGARRNGRCHDPSDSAAGCRAMRPMAMGTTNRWPRRRNDAVGSRHDPMRRQSR